MTWVRLSFYREFATFLESHSERKHSIRFDNNSVFCYFASIIEEPSGNFVEFRASTNTSRLSLDEFIQVVPSEVAKFILFNMDQFHCK